MLYRRSTLNIKIAKASKAAYEKGYEDGFNVNKDHFIRFEDLYQILDNIEKESYYNSPHLATVKKAFAQIRTRSHQIIKLRGATNGNSERR